ncbi:MAG: hypothetical protein ACW97Z_17150 [Candidatus Hodarchaeales archaeon]|jgi:hypothetical protein
MVIINSRLQEKKEIIFGLRIITSLIWLGTAFRRIFMPTFEERITAMAAGSPLLPSSIMEWVVTNWVLIFILVLSLEITSSLSLLTGTLARAGALVATINGFGIGLAGIGVSVVDLIIPWSAAIITLILFLFTHPGLYHGIDGKLQAKNLPQWLKMWI